MHPVNRILKNIAIIAAAGIMLTVALNFLSFLLQQSSHTLISVLSISISAIIALFSSVSTFAPRKTSRLKSIKYLIPIGVLAVVSLIDKCNPSFTIGSQGGRQFFTVEKLRLWNIFLQYNFFISLFTVGFFLQFTLRPRILKNLTWKKISDPWLKFSGVSAVSVGGFGFIAMNKEYENKLFKITTDPNIVDIKMLSTFYIILILLIGLSKFLSLIGKQQSETEDSHQPLIWFVPSFFCAWLANLGLYTLFFDSIILTLNAHMNA